MSDLTIGYGTMLATLGVGGYVATGKKSKTALIPAAFGVVEIGLGLLARSPLHRKGALVGAAIVGVAAFAGSARGLAKLPALVRGEPVERPEAVIAQSLMASLSALYMGALVISTRSK